MPSETISVMRVKYLILLSLVALTFACTDKKGGNGNQVESSDDTDSLSWGTASLRIEEPVAKGDSICYQIELKLDTLAGESALARSLAAMLCDSVLHQPKQLTMQEAVAAHADSIETEWKAEFAEMYEMELENNYMFQYYYTLEGCAVENGRKDILSYQVNTDCYLGGAHGSYVVLYYNFDKKSGKLLNIRDIVPVEKEKLVIDAMKKQLCEDWDAADLAELQEMTGITMLGDVYLTNNFLLKKDSIEFLFNQYEIAPYAAGLIEVTIPLPANP